MGPLKILLFMMINSILASCGEYFKYDQLSPKATGGDLSSIPPIPLLGDIRNNQGRPTVLLFSSTNCGSCDLEHKEILSYLNGRNPNSNQSKINIYTLMVGSREDSQAIAKWKNLIGVSWKVGPDNQRVLMKKFCDKNITPCMVIFNEKNKMVFSAQRAGIKMEEIFSYTGGPWFDESTAGPLPTHPEPVEVGPEIIQNDLNKLSKENEEHLYIEMGNKDLKKSFSFNQYSPSHKKTLLLFASYSCGPCIAEHEDVFKNKDQISSLANIFTIIKDIDFMTDYYWEDMNFLKINTFIDWPTFDVKAYSLIENIFKDPSSLPNPPMLFIFNEENKLSFYHFGSMDIREIIKELNK